jgi:hypothetical protein
MGKSTNEDTVQLAAGKLHQVIKQVFSLTKEVRAHVFIRGDLVGRLSIFDILALSMREDFPST